MWVAQKVSVVQLVMPMPIMIWLAVIVEAAIGNWIDMIILLLIQFINAGIGWCALVPPLTLLPAGPHFMRALHSTVAPEAECGLLPRLLADRHGCEYRPFSATTRRASCMMLFWTSCFLVLQVQHERGLADKGTSNVSTGTRRQRRRTQ